MDLWIRSQDKSSLSKIVSIKIERTQLLGNTKNDDWVIYLGTYKTKRRALEVLDEIQKLLEPKMIIKTEENPFKPNFDDAVLRINPTHETVMPLETIVYQMPEE